MKLEHNSVVFEIWHDDGHAFPYTKTVFDYRIRSAILDKVCVLQTWRIRDLVDDELLK